MATPPSVSGATPPGGSRKSHEVDLAVLPECQALAVHTAVRSVTAWASAIGTDAGARVKACVSSTYPHGRQPGALGFPRRRHPQQRWPDVAPRQPVGGDHHPLRISSISIFQMGVRRLMRATLRGHPCRMPLVARPHSPSCPPT